MRRVPDLSPAYLAAQNKYSPKTRILIGVASNDPFIGTRHGIDFAVARGCLDPYRCSNTWMVKLEPVDKNDSTAVYFVHSYVTQESLNEYRKKEQEIADCTVDSTSCPLITE